jgi:hypothetical protein
MSQVAVRLRGKIAEIAAPPEDAGKFLFNLLVTVGNIEEGLNVGPFGPFDTRELAKEALKEEGISVMKMIKEDIGGLKDGTYFDMKEGGKVKNWTVH